MLCAWVYAEGLNKKKEKLDRIYKKQLEEIGVTWRLRLGNSWNDMICILLQHKEHERACNTRASCKEIGIALSDSLNCQQQNPRKKIPFIKTT